MPFFSTYSDSGSLLISGELDICSSAALRDLLRNAIEDHADLVLDLSAVQSCDTAAVQILWSAKLTAERAGKRLQYKSVAPAIEDVCRALGMKRPDA